MRIYETPRVTLHLSFAIAPIILIVFIDCDRQRKIVILSHILRLKVHDLWQREERLSGGFCDRFASSFSFCV